MPHSGESRTKETWSLTSEQWQWHVFGKNWLEKTIDKRQRKNVWDLVDIWDILIQLSCNRWGNRGLESYLLSAYRLISGKSGSRFLISCFSFWCWSTTSCSPILPVARMNAPPLQPPSRQHILAWELYLHQGEKARQWFRRAVTSLGWPHYGSYRMGLDFVTIQCRLDLRGVLWPYWPHQHAPSQGRPWAWKKRAAPQWYWIPALSRFLCLPPPPSPTSSSLWTTLHFLQKTALGIFVRHKNAHIVRRLFPLGRLLKLCGSLMAITSLWTR